MAFMGIPFDSRLVEAGDGSFYEDRTVFSADIAHYFGYLSTDGICLGFGETLGNQLKVEAGTGSNVILNPGTIKIQGRMGWITEAETIQATAGSSRPRYDTAVIELNLNVAVRGFTFKLIQGTPSASPTPPALTRNENVWQLGLANIYRAANSTSLGTITDTRKDEDRCGISTANIAINNIPINYLPTIPITKGGTGATNIAAAQKNLGVDENYIILNLSAEYNLTTSSTKIPFNETKYSKGDLLTGSNNGVRVGEGVTKVKISANLRMRPRTSADTSNRISIYKNNTDMTSVGVPNIGGTDAIATFAEYEIDVTEGDVIYLYAQTSTANVGRIGTNTQFKVEVLR